MVQTVNTQHDFSVLIATPNGSGSQSPNHILAKAIFRSGNPVGGKNIFPSNIAGLPTWFVIRVNQNGHVSMKRKHNVVLAKNADTLYEDITKLDMGGYFFYDQELKFDQEHKSTAEIIRTQNIKIVPIPFRELTKDLSDSIKMRKLLTNTIYLGIFAELFQLDANIVEQTLSDYFANKENVIELNIKALDAGRTFARNDLTALNFNYREAQTTNQNQNKLFIDGNSAAALGALSGGCTFVSWYPITPATSLAESFQEFARQTRVHGENDTRFAQVQAEDELSAVNMVIGAGWAGCRAMTCTSGPGLSLMSEAAGLSYFAEVPTVIWDVQRAGPSTGLPTRTMQGDLRAAAHLSHGDTEHIVLLPANPEECFAMAPLAFELAEMYQTLVLVLSDLDIGMNYFIANEFKQNSQPYNRGKVLSAHDLEQLKEYARYRDTDGDGIGYRTLPGTKHMSAAYFTRGTAHNEKSGYSEDSENFKNLLDRLKRKIAGSEKSLPQPIASLNASADVTFITYGSTDQIISEVVATLQKNKIIGDSLRIRALPLAAGWVEPLKNKKKIVVLEQNRDGQMFELMKQKYPELASRLQSVRQYDGLPISADYVVREVLALLEKKV